jgi:S-adenosylmethionine:tRNA ribosyltransferase-isomerase
LRCDLLDYHLPEDRIARRPAEVRDAARLLVVDPAEAGVVAHRHVHALADLLPRGALVIVNDTRVVPARLLGNKVGTGGQVELLLVRPRADEAAGATADPTDAGGSPAAGAPASTARFFAMGRASKPLRPGAEVTFGDGALTALVEGRDEEEGGLFAVTLRARDGDVQRAIERVGHMPLPPYLRRADDASDRERYQTVYARVPGAIAAPTAGLHVSHALLERFRERDIERAAVTLHVGLGTFQPVTVADLDEHPMHTEAFVVPEETRLAVARARERGAPVVAIGTTAVRALESAADPENVGHVRATSGDTRLLIQPGFPFRVVDVLLTNFHLPRSTLLALVYAFGGATRVRRAYEIAVETGYRFYSYGDAMLLRREPEGRS